jgi:hypothetical protein
MRAEPAGRSRAVLSRPWRQLPAGRHADTWSQVAPYAPGDEVWPSVLYDDAPFVRAARYFFALDDVTEVTALSHGYERVDRARLPET